MWRATASSTTYRSGSSSSSAAAPGTRARAATPSARSDPGSSPRMRSPIRTRLRMWLEVDGKRYQNGNSGNMIFRVPQLISYLSTMMSLHPGDVISTGTPAGVGLGQRPPVYLASGQFGTARDRRTGRAVSAGESLEPMMRIDSHVHLWRFEAEQYPWISTDMRSLKQDRLASDLRPLMVDQGIDACVAIQAREKEEETDFLLDLARKIPGSKPSLVGSISRVTTSHSDSIVGPAQINCAASVMCCRTTHRHRRLYRAPHFRAAFDCYRTDRSCTRF